MERHGACSLHFLEHGKKVIARERDERDYKGTFPGGELKSRWQKKIMITEDRDTIDFPRKKLKIKKKICEHWGRRN